MKKISHMLHMKINVNRITLQCSWLRNASYCQNIKIIKSISVKNKALNNHQIRLQKFTVFHDYKEIK